LLTTAVRRVDGGLFFLLNLPLVKFSALSPEFPLEGMGWTLSNKNIGCTLGAVFNFAGARRLVVS